MHIKKKRSNNHFRSFEEDLRIQEKMNLAFIKSLPQETGKALTEIGREAEEGLVPEFIPPEKIEKHKQEVF